MRTALVGPLQTTPTMSRIPLTRTPPAYKAPEGLHPCLGLRTSTLSDGSIVVQAQIKAEVSDAAAEILKREVARFLHFAKVEKVAFSLLIHVTPTGRITFDQAKRLNEYMKAKKTTTLKCLKGTNIVLPSPSLEMMILSVFALLPPLKPLTTRVLQEEDYKYDVITEWDMPKGVQKEIMKGFADLPWPDESGAL